MRIRLAASLAALLALSSAAMAPAARAETLPPLTAEQSASLGRALFVWTRGLLGDSAGFTATPADGFYELVVPVKRQMTSLGASMDGGPATAHVTQDAEGRWHFEAIAYPSPLRTTVPDPAGGKPTTTVQTIREQTGSALIDPTLSTPSHWELTQSGIEQRGDAGAETVMKVARAATREEWLPAEPGRVDTAMVSRADEVSLQATVPGDADSQAERPVDVAMRQATITFETKNIDLDRFSRFTRDALAFIGEMRPKAQEALTPAQRTALHGLVRLSRDLAREAKMSFVADTLGVSVGGQAFVLRRMAFDQKLATLAGKIDLRMRLRMEGVEPPPGSLPPAMRDLLPRELVVAPYVTGAPVEDIYAMLDEAIDQSSDKDALAEDAQARFAKAPITTGVDELSFDLGPARFSAHGQIVASGAADADGTAVIEATGLDALIKKAGGDPMLKQGTPVLIFLKGIGEQAGEKIVWNVAYKDGALSVNGTDMSAMIPGK